MEAKLLQESQSVLRKMFEESDTKGTGFISSSLIPKLLQSLRLEVEIKDEELKKQMTLVDPEETGQLNYDAFSKVILYFLVKEQRNDSTAFVDKRDIALGYFQSI